MLLLESTQREGGQVRNASGPLCVWRDADEEKIGPIRDRSLHMDGARVAPRVTTIRTDTRGRCGESGFPVHPERFARGSFATLRMTWDGTLGDTQADRYT